jgi:hypothetical protein
MTTPQINTKANKTDAGNGSKAICRVSNVLCSPSPDPKRSAEMKSRTLLISSLCIALIGAAGRIYADAKSDRSDVIITIPRSKSLLSTSEVEGILKSGITRERLRERINSLPLVRIGPGYVLYYLKDGRLLLPTSNTATEPVTVWRLSKPDGTTIAEQVAAGQPATRPESKPEGDQKPQPKSEGRSR